MIDKVKFDGKHWIGKKRPKEPLQIHSYQHVAQQARKMLGEDGIVAIPNARSDERRYEEFIAHGLNKIHEPLSNREFFYDSHNQIYFIKAQEVNTKTDNFPVILLFYNLPIGKNLQNDKIEKLLDEAKENNCIIGINGPKSSLGGLIEIGTRKKFFSQIDFFVGYSGTSTSTGNSKAQIIYEDMFKKEKIGTIAVSGGHRTPRNSLEYVLNGFGQTLGSSYTEIPKPRKENFMDDLRTSLRNAKEDDMHTESIFAETLFRHLPSIYVGDKVLGFFK